MLLRQVALSTPQRLPKCFFSLYRASVKIALMVNFNILATLVMIFSRCCLDRVCRVIICFFVNWCYITRWHQEETTMLQQSGNIQLLLCRFVSSLHSLVRILKTKTKLKLPLNNCHVIIFQHSRCLEPHRGYDHRLLPQLGVQGPG